MRKGVVKNWWMLAVCFAGMFSAFTAKAENEAVFDPATLELNIPKVIVGPYAYDITMKLGTQGFVVTDFGLNNAFGYASGTYEYNPSTGVLGVNFIQSTFEDNGPPVGYFESKVISLTETQLTLRNSFDELEIWTRISGTGGDLNGQWLQEESASRLIVEFSDSNTVKYSQEYKYFPLQKKTISIDGDFSDWEERDRVYQDTDGPECGNVPGRDLKEVYVAYDDFFTYVRFVINGPLDGSFGYKFGNSIHINVQNNTLMYASGSLLPNGVSLPDSYLAINGNQIEYKAPTLENWHDRSIQAWLDQGSETICRDLVTLPILLGW